MPAPYLVENGNIAIKSCRHGMFMYNRHDTFVGRGLDQYGEWCDFEIQLLRAFIKPGDTVIDAGANIGTHTVALANAVGPTGTVHAYEPQRRLFTMLAGNVALNALEWVVCHQEAVGDAMGQICVPPLPPPDTVFNHSAVPLVDANSPTPESGSGETVPLVTLDSLDLSKCAVIKVDVEGMEAAALRGATRLIERCRPVIYVEHNDANSSNRIGDVLELLDYAACWSMHPYYNEANYYSNPVNVWENKVSCSAEIPWTR
jgi:FkbM family methyltransferase